MPQDAFGLLSESPAMQPLLAALTGATTDEVLQPYCVTQAILFTDLENFSRGDWYAILQRLLRFERALRAVVTSLGGTVVTSMGDSHMILYGTVAEALRCVRRVRGLVPDIAFAAGLGYGRMLLCHHNHGRIDVFGPQVNAASRLGEDIATGTQVLLTPQAYAQLSVQEQRAFQVFTAQYQLAYEWQTGG